MSLACYVRFDIAFRDFLLQLEAHFRKLGLALNSGCNGYGYSNAYIYSSSLSTAASIDGEPFLNYHTSASFK